jgi:hypothetical protein
MMKVELTRFKVKPGKSRRVDEWMKLLNDNLPAVLLTLADERMYVEAIFREVVDAGDFLYWFSIQGEGGRPIEQSVHEIDRRHIEFSRECLEPETKIDLITEVVMLPESVRAAMLTEEK